MNGFILKVILFCSCISLIGCSLNGDASKSNQANVLYGFSIQNLKGEETKMDLSDHRQLNNPNYFESGEILKYPDGHFDIWIYTNESVIDTIRISHVDVMKFMPSAKEVKENKLKRVSQFKFNRKAFRTNNGVISEIEFVKNPDKDLHWLLKTYSNNKLDPHEGQFDFPEDLYQSLIQNVK